jgi:hypothetical protein
MSNPFTEARRAARRELSRNGYAPMLGAPVHHGVPREPNGRVSRSHIRNGGARPRAYSPDSLFRRILRSTPAIQLALIDAPPAPPFFKAARTGKLAFREFVALMSWYIATRLPFCWSPLFEIATAEGITLTAIDADLALDFARERISADTVTILDSAVDNPEPDLVELRPALAALTEVWGPRPQ